MINGSETYSSDSSYDSSTFASISSRRRVVTAMASIAYAEVRDETGPRGYATRKDWYEHVSREGAQVFRNMYRVDIPSF